MNHPRVTVICLCYNHQRFLREAMESVLGQTYDNVEVIIVDDASTDGSKAMIQDISRQHAQIQTVLLENNVGNCAAFNRGLQLARGEWVVDFSTDDVMMPDRIQKQVEFFLTQTERVGVVFTDAVYIDENGKALRNHYDYLFRKKFIASVPQGNVFRSVLTTYFICSPTMMVRKKVMDALKGYDETLAYEDFDFWVRASREFEFSFLNEKTTLVRKSSNSMSTGWYENGDPQLHSTFLVCQKALSLCRDLQDRIALRWRVRYEFKHAVFSQNRMEAKLFEGLLRQLGNRSPYLLLTQLISYLPLPWARMRKLYHHLRYR